MRHIVSTFVASLIMLVSDTGLLRAQDVSISEIEAGFLKNVRQVTSSFVKAGEGYFSPDGKRIVYQAITKDYPFYQIYIQSLEGGRPRLVSTGRGRTTCSYFTVDGKNILFASSHLDPEMTTTEAPPDAASGRQFRLAAARPGWESDSDAASDGRV